MSDVLSDELSTLERRLEQATAAEGPADLLGDVEARQLREGWLALGELLRAVESASGEPRVCWQPPRRRDRAAWTLAVLAAAASLLMGVTLAGRWSGIRLREAGAGRPKAGGTALAGVHDGRAIAMHAEPPGSAQCDAASARPVEEKAIGWDDPLDQQIVLAAEAIVSIQQDWDSVDEALGLLYSGVEEIRQDLDQSTL